MLHGIWVSVCIVFAVVSKIFLLTLNVDEHEFYEYFTNSHGRVMKSLDEAAFRFQFFFAISLSEVGSAGVLSPSIHSFPCDFLFQIFIGFYRIFFSLRTKMFLPLDIRCE